nr:hypothetical protein [Tanacetum cinerariifolium]
LIESQRSDKIKDGVRYNVVPPPAADLYLSTKKDLSWTGLPEFVDDTVTDYNGQNRIYSASENGEPTDSILFKPAVKFVKAVDRPAERPTTNKAETTTWGSYETSHRPASHRPHGPPMRPMRSNINGARPKRTSAVRPQYRAPWVPTVNRKLPTGQLRDMIERCSEDKKKQRNKKLKDSEAEHQV